jgi:type I restriction enzyme S subunit
MTIRICGDEAMRQPLKDLAAICAGQGAPQGDHNYCENGTPFIKAGNLQELLEGKAITSIQKVSDEVAKKHKLRLYPKGTILFAKSGMSCIKGYIYVLPQSAYVVSHLACITPNEDISEYLRYYFNYHKPNQLVKDAAYPSISLSDVGNLVVDMKPESERNEIVSVLQHTESIITLRQQQLQKLNELVKARFVEMFGIYPANPKGWETGTIRDVVSDVRYGSSRPAVDGGKYPYLRMNNITYGGELDLSDTKRIDIPDNELDKCTVRRGDVLFNRTNSKELVGKTCVYNRDDMMVLAGFVIRVRVSERILPEFLSEFLNTEFSKQMLLAMCKTAIGQANINAQEMQNIGLYLPPIELQRKFVQFKEQTDKSKVAVQKALDEAQLLFDSLMQKYFG